MVETGRGGLLQNNMYVESNALTVYVFKSQHYLIYYDKIVKYCIRIFYCNIMGVMYNTNMNCFHCS